MKRTFFYLLLLLFCIIPTFANSEYFFSIIDGKNGISQNNIKAICQDSYGFMWFGTRNQLNRYDGVSLKVFNCYDPIAEKGNDNISALFEDPDRKLWIGTDMGVFIFDPITEKFTAFDIPTIDSTRIIHWVSDIRMDEDNNIWIIIPNQGAFRYNRTNKKLFRYTVVDELKPSVSNPQCIAIEKSGRVWIGTNGEGVFLYNKSQDTFTQYLGNADNNDSLAGKDIYTICNYDDEILVGIHEGKIMKLNKRKNILTDIAFADANYKIIRDISLLDDNDIWICTESGLFVMNEKKHTIEHIREDPWNRNSLSDDFIEKIYKDREGGIWIGTYFGGVNYLPARNNTFENFIPLSKKNSIGSKRIRELREDKNGNIWIATEDAGVHLYNPKEETFKKIGNSNYRKTLGLLIQDTKIWVGYFKNGLDIISLENNSSQHYTPEELGLNETSVYTLCEDRFGKIWMGNAWGVFVAEKDKMNFRRMDEFGFIFTFDIIEDSEGYIWVATMGLGVFQYDQEKGILKHFTADGKPNSLSSNSVSSITEDHSGKLWFSTDRGGICSYDKRSNSFTTYSIADGLPDNIAYKILEDKQHNLWFGTNKGLVKFNPKSKDVRVFTQNDGLMSNQFNYKSGLISSSGKFYIGGLEGMIAFNPEEFKKNQYIPSIYITKLSIHNKEINADTKNSPLKKSILHTRKIELDYDQSTISFDFVALSYAAPLANQYTYKMENIDNDWTTTQNNRSATYAKLPPGKYIFKVKGSNNDGLWNEEGTSIEIEIMPPWWASNIAYAFYIILTLALIYLIINYYANKSRKRSNEKQRLFEVEKDKELYEAKVGFFTDIAHEIRTPVTLINGPLESILEMPIKDEELKRNLSIIEQNTKHLLSLINQLLDFRKVDSNKIALTFRKTDITQLLSETKNRFEETKTFEGKTLEIDLPEKHLFAWVDKEGLSKILNNLFTNAIKYSDKRVKIQLSSDNEYFTIQFINDGELIPSESSEKIFEPFFQVKSNNIGSGIGLSLARSLAELHNGYLYYESDAMANTFTLRLPLKHSAADDLINDDDNELSREYIIERNEILHDRGNCECVLVVEDNIDMLDFIANKLKENYIVEKATNGKEAIEILKTKPVDIIVSDIMMPEMDGFELCQIIKSNIEYSHIIFILLTAKSDLISKIRGLELGADAYVEKPFSFQYFSTLLHSLLNNKKRDKELFLRKPFLPIQQVSMNKADEQFMNRVIEVINENIVDSDFNVERLAELVYMSRSSLHRKFKNLLDLTPTDFIRIMRLKKAAQLIKENGSRVNEVCYLVGINSPSYFIKLFQKQFGMTPKEFEKQESNNSAN